MTTPTLTPKSEPTMTVKPTEVPTKSPVKTVEPLNAPSITEKPKKEQNTKPQKTDKPKTIQKATIRPTTAPTQKPTSIPKTTTKPTSTSKTAVATTKPTSNPNEDIDKGNEMLEEAGFWKNVYLPTGNYGMLIQRFSIENVRKAVVKFEDYFDSWDCDIDISCIVGSNWGDGSGRYYFEFNKKGIYPR